MRSTPLEDKTVRPGLMRYSFYSTERSAKPAKAVNHKKKQKKAQGRRLFYSLLIVMAIVLVGFSGYRLMHTSTTSTYSPKNPVSVTKPAPKTTKAVATKPPTVNVDYCAGNTLARFVKVSISLRHMWACTGSTVMYDSPVVTGIEYLAADRTPTGTYEIYSKQTDVVLTGSDSTGSWSDPVSYWMPFLRNQYGVYGFHDATWRSPSAFGNIDPNSADASHGCVELPLATAAWLYNWSTIGTTVQIVV